MIKPEITRRGFLKLAGASAASSAVLTGCGPASRYVVREPYASMPEYTYNGESTYYATTCQECPAGCGIVVRTTQGRAIKVEGNPYHPVNSGKTCARGQAIIQGLYNPDRVQFPVSQKRANSLSDDRLSWEEAVSVVANALNNSPGDQIAFLMDTNHDHLADFFSDLATALGTSHLYRFSPSSFLDARSTVMESSSDFFTKPTNLNFDIENADLILSFGANFLETWNSPVSYTRQYANFRKGKSGRRGMLIQFEPRMSQTASVADQWVPIIPGSESYLALALGSLVAEATGQLVGLYSDIDPVELAGLAGIEFDTIAHIAQRITEAEAPLAIPGSLASAQTSGKNNIQSILSLNSLAVSSGKPNLVFSQPAQLWRSKPDKITSPADLSRLVDAINAGQIKTLFVHGANPIFEIPSAFGFDKALVNLATVISFSSFPDETALKSDYIFPDHTNLESWGYQRVNTAVRGETISGLQPVVAPFFETQSTLDVFLSAFKINDGELSKRFPFSDEVAYLENQLSELVGKENALIRAGESKTFMAQFQQFGGWWNNNGDREQLASNLNQIEPGAAIANLNEKEFYLHIFTSPILGDKGANKPWLQETPDPTTTVMWNTWIEIHPDIAEELGIHDDDVVKLITPNGEIKASVYLYPGIRPDTIAVVFGQGHTAYGRYATDRGANPYDLLGTKTNSSGDITLSPLKVRIEKTGEHRQLARLESRIGVYGFDEH